MRLRSLLFVPGDRPDRMSKALASGADALVLDLEDSVLPGAKAEARAAVAAFLAHPRVMPLFVRVNAGGALMDQDLEAIVPHAPDGIMLPKAEGGQSVAGLDKRLVVLGNTDASILPIATETPSAVFALGSYGGVSGRLCGLTWGAEDLPAATGASASRLPDGNFTAPYEMLRSLTLFGAHAAGVAAIETVYPAIADVDGLAAYAGRGRRDGFSGMLAIHPVQVPIINAAFTPSQAEIDWARAVVEAFARNPRAGAVQLNGRMLDAPHLKQARAILERTGP
jgi:citrate lyase subunit beta / citryl-CoA lyase